MQSVVAGLIRREGKLLIGQRKRSGAHPLLWEFPGGKVEPDEDEVEALVRELREELSIEATIGPEFTRYEFAYKGKPPILLVFLNVIAYGGTPRNLGAFEAIAWETPTGFHRLPFLEGDLPLIQLLGQVHIDQIE